MNDRAEPINRFELPVGTKGNKAIILIPASASKAELRNLRLWINKVLIPFAPESEERTLAEEIDDNSKLDDQQLQSLKTGRGF